MHALALVLALLAASADLHVLVKTRAGREIEGRAALASIELTTDFGRAEVLAEHLRQVELGPTDTVTTTRGVTLTGRVKLVKLELATDDGPIDLPRATLASVLVLRPASFVPGEITDGSARNGVTYHLRAPENADPGQPLPAVLILHGSNMNARDYVSTIAAAWPDLARDYLLIGVNGERRAASPDGSPRFNYTYVNYVGRSKYEGYPGSDRESPALVAEVLREIKAAHPISRIFVGGHSQGGYLTYSLLMNEPELFAGAFPISAGLIIQAEPGAFDHPELRDAQRQTPLAIVHGENDTVVSFNDALHAYEAFEDAGFPMVRLFTDADAAHMFARLPVKSAVRWLETFAAEDPGALLDFAERAADAGEWRDASAALLRLSELAGAALADRVGALASRVERAAAEAAATLPPPADAESADADHRAWVDAYLSFRARFGLTAAAAEANAHYAALREAQQKRADELFAEARRAYARGDRAAGAQIARTLIRECPASDKYRLARRWVDEK